jgi:hypothetical protein
MAASNQPPGSPGDARLLADVRPEPGLHKVAPWELGEFAVLARRRGATAAQAAFPDIAAHLAPGCSTCAPIFAELLQFVDSELSMAPAPPIPSRPAGDPVPLFARLRSLLFGRRGFAFGAVAALVALVFLGGALAIGLNRQPATAVQLAGRIDGSQTLVALVVGESDVVAYVCDGATTAVWLRGRREGDTIRLSSGSELVARLTPSGAAGTFTSPDGRSAAFRADAVSGAAGLYRAESTQAGLLGGWILLPDGEQRGATRDQRTGAIFPGGTLDPTQSTVNLNAGTGSQIPAAFRKVVSVDPAQ